MIARFISFLFHPIHLPLLSVFILLQLPVYENFRLNEAYRIAVYLVFSVNTIIMPGLFIYSLYKQQRIQSIQMESNPERRIPYLASIVFFLFSCYLLSKIQFPTLYIFYFVAATAAIFILYLFTYSSIKPSAHLAAMGGLCGMLFVSSVYFNINLSWMVMLAVLACGLVAGSRIHLKAHTPLEVGLGFLIGFSTQAFLLIIA